MKQLMNCEGSERETNPNQPQRRRAFEIEKYNKGLLRIDFLLKMKKPIPLMQSRRMI